MYVWEGVYVFVLAGSTVQLCTAILRHCVFIYLLIMCEWVRVNVVDETCNKKPRALQVATSGGGQRSRPLTPDLMARGRLGGDKAGPSVRPIKRRLWTMKRNLHQRHRSSPHVCRYFPRCVYPVDTGAFEMIFSTYSTWHNYRYRWPEIISQIPEGGKKKTFGARVVSLFYLGGAVTVRWNWEKSWKISYGETVNKKVLLCRGSSRVFWSSEKVTAPTRGR